MTGLLRTIVLRVTLAGIAAAAALRLAGGGALREVIRLATGLLLLLALLQPLAGLRLPRWSGWTQAAQTDVDALYAQNARTAMSTVGATIADTLEQRAAQAGFDCAITVEMGNDAAGLLQIAHLTVRYRAQDAPRLTQLRALLTSECGVPADRQELIER
ncbi:MAG: hypothetical protein Q4D31_04345 [Eubacteriales bacterium]|nr:hypothetical protein [Eubacteriales bacterium]